jgi:hypothetical protein
MGAGINTTLAPAPVTVFCGGNQCMGINAGQEGEIERQARDPAMERMQANDICHRLNAKLVEASTRANREAP